MVHHQQFIINIYPGDIKLFTTLLVIYLKHPETLLKSWAVPTLLVTEGDIYDQGAP